MKKAADGSEIRILISDGIRDAEGRLSHRNKALKIRGDAEKRHYSFVDDFADDGIAAAQLPELSPSGKKVWHVIDSS